MKKRNEKIEDREKQLFNYAKYSSLAFQMIFIILLGVFGGIKLDEWLGLKPVLTITLTILAVILSIYYAIKDLLKLTK